MRQVLKSIILASLIGSLACVVASQAFSATYDAELVKKAKAEGKLMWYGCVPDAAAGLLSAFEKKFGIKAEFYEGACYPTLERFRTEQRANRFVADVFSSYTDVMLTMKKEDLLAPYKSPFLAEYDKRFVEKDNAYTAVKPHAYFFTVNRKTVPDKNLWPKKWADYLNPNDAWKGRLGIFDPRSASTAYNVIYGIHRHFGEKTFNDMFKKLSILSPAIYETSLGGIQACVTGEKPYMFYMMNNHLATALQQGAPLEVIVPEDGMPYIIVNVGIVKTAPHPNAAKLFVDWSLDQTGAQKFYVEDLNQYPLHPNAAPPKGFPKFSTLKLWDLDFGQAESMRKELQNKWAEIMGVTRK